MSVAEHERAVTLALEEAEALAEAREHLTHRQVDQATQAVDRALALAFRRAPAVPVSLAARLLCVSEPTVRKWIAAGILQTVRSRPVGIDPRNVFEILGIVRHLRKQGKDPTIRELLLARIDDELLLRKPALQQSLRQMREGEIHWVDR